MSVLANRKIAFEEVDISDPLCASEKNFMREHSQPAGSDPTPLPPQIFNDDVYCGVTCLYFYIVLIIGNVVVIRTATSHDRLHQSQLLSDVQ